MILCTHCRQHLPPSTFYKRAGGVRGYNSWCVPCIKAKPRKKCKVKQRGNRLQKYWPGTRWYEAVALYRKLCIAQDGVCAVCKRDRLKLYVDHCHTTGKVRGLLCMHCNSAEGFLKTPAVAQRLVQYMKVS